MAKTTDKAAVQERLLREGLAQVAAWTQSMAEARAQRAQPQAPERPSTSEKAAKVVQARKPGR
jgi:hypothetical protein